MVYQIYIRAENYRVWETKIKPTDAGVNIPIQICLIWPNDFDTVFLVYLTNKRIFKPLGNRTWRLIHGDWYPEGSSMDAREEAGHQNWGLAQRKKNKTFNQQSQSDYTINYLGKFSSAKVARNYLNIQVHCIFVQKSRSPL